MRMLKHRSLILVVVWGAVAGCTVVEVKPVDRRQHDMRLVCIEHNQAVKMSGFLPMLEKSFADHGISHSRLRLFRRQAEFPLREKDHRAGGNRGRCAADG